MTPILYSFRRCPYAMRARLALAAAQTPVEVREIVLRRKPQAFLDAPPSATVPCLVTESGAKDESFDIMLWALARNDPEGWLQMPAEGRDWIARCDGPFKFHLDRAKYATRYPDENPEEHRDAAEAILADLDSSLSQWIFGKPTLADFAILPFVRQYAFIDKTRFDRLPLPKLQGWLERFLTSERLSHVMQNFPPWQAGGQPIVIP